MTASDQTDEPAARPVVVRVVLADRPGALGAVASRIGAVGADVVAVEVVERERGSAVDDLSVVLPAGVPIELLRREIGEVDQVRVEHVRPVNANWDPLLGLLRLASTLVAGSDDEIVHHLLDGIRDELGAEWACLVDGSGRTVTVSGPVPEVPWSPLDDGIDPPPDIAVAPLGSWGTVVAGRSAAPFRPREREAIRLLAEVARSGHTHT